MADMTAWQNEQRALMQRLLAGDYSPYEIDATLTGGINPYGQNISAYQTLNRTGNASDPLWMYANDPISHQAPSGDAQYGWVDPAYTAAEIAAWEAGRPAYSLFTNKQLQQLQQAQGQLLPGQAGADPNSTLLGWDAAGRPIVQGEKIWGKGGYWSPTGRALDTSDPEINGGSLGEFSWKWNPAERNGVPASAYDQYEDTLLRSGVQAPTDWSGGALGKQGQQLLSFVGSLGLSGAGALGAFEGLGNLADAAKMGLSESTGLAPSTASNLVDAAASAGIGALKSAVTGKDPLTGAISGGAQGAYNGLTGGSTPSGEYSPTGGSMDMSGMTMYDGGTYPSYDATGYLGDVTGGTTGGSWYDNIDWTKIGSAAIPSLTGLVGGLLANNAQNNATSTAAQQYNNGLAAQLAMYNQSRADFAPYQQMGTQGVQNYNKFIQDPSAAFTSPAYQWQANQIDKNMNRQLSARGRSNSTYGMQALGNAYGNLASTEYDKAYQRMLDPIKIGQGAANSAGNINTAAAGAYQQNATQQAANTTQAGMNNASLYSGLGALPQNYLNMQNAQNLNNAYMNFLNK